MLKKITINTIIYGIGPQLPKFANLLILPLITPFLTTVDFGIYGVSQAYVLLFQNLKTLGLDAILVNSYVKRPKLFRPIWQVLFGVMIINSIILSLLLAIVLYFSFREEIGDDILSFILLNCIPLMLFSSAEVIYFRLYQLKENASAGSGRIVLAGAVNVFITYYGIVYLNLDYMGWIWALFLSGLTSFLVSIYPIWKEKIFPVFKLKLTIVRGSLSISMPLIPHYYSRFILNSSDRLIFDILEQDVNRVGLYNAAYSIGNYYNIVTTAFKRAVSPTVVKLLKKNNLESINTLKKIFSLFSTILLALTFISSIWSKEIIFLLFKNDSFQDIYYVTIWIFMTYNYLPIHMSAHQVMVFHEKTSQLWLRAVIAIFFNTILNFTLIPIFGVNVAVIVSFCSYYIMALSTYTLSDFKDIKMVLMPPLKWCLFTIVLTIMALFVVDYSQFFKLLISIAVLISVLLFLSRRISLLNFKV